MIHDTLAVSYIKRREPARDEVLWIRLACEISACKYTFLQVMMMRVIFNNLKHTHGIAAAGGEDGDEKQVHVDCTHEAHLLTELSASGSTK